MAKLSLPNNDFFEGTKMSFGEHLEELRRALFRAVLGLSIGVMLGFLVAEYVVDWIKRPLTNAMVDHSVDRNINTLIDYRYARIHRARDGERGRGSDCNGRGADDVELRFPVGTIITDEATGERIADLEHHGHRVVVARGGAGEIGRAHV